MTSLWRHSRLTYYDLGPNFLTQGVELLPGEVWQVSKRNSQYFRSYLRKNHRGALWPPPPAGRGLTRAWPGSQPNAIDRGGGAYNAPQANSQTNDRSETGEAVLERSRRDGSKALLKFFLKGHVSGQGQVKGQNWAFQHFGSQNRQLDSNRPKLGRNTLKG